MAKLLGMSKRFLSFLTLIIFVSAQILSIGAVRAETVNMGYDASRPLHPPKVVNGVDYQYDRSGNLENDGERVLSWNADNLPVKIVKGGVEVNLFYDADGRRIVKQTGQDRTKRTVYVNQYYQLLAPDSLATKFYFIGDRRIAFSSTTNSELPTINYLHHDYLGSTILATNQDSQPTSEALSYFPYGNKVSMSQRASGSMNYLFTGQEFDSESALYNYNARLYNPQTGVFISPDTAGGSFAYAAGNPLRFTDPTGHYVELGAGSGGGEVDESYKSVYFRTLFNLYLAQNEHVRDVMRGSASAEEKIFEMSQFINKTIPYSPGILSAFWQLEQLRLLDLQLGGPLQTRRRIPSKYREDTREDKQLLEEKLITLRQKRGSLSAVEQHQQDLFVCYNFADLLSAYIQEYLPEVPVYASGVPSHSFVMFESEGGMMFIDPTYGTEVKPLGEIVVDDPGWEWTKVGFNPAASSPLASAARFRELVFEALFGTGGVAPGIARAERIFMFGN